jgi:putative SOS response-associated peptidase YedK
MCGRTALTTPPDELREAFGLDSTPRLAPRYNVPPSQPLDVVRAGRSGRHLESLRWGLVPSWATDPKIGNRLPLARVETVTTTNAFREAIRLRRCLVAVDAFYEWRKEGKTSSPFVARRRDRGPFALAALWERWVSGYGEVIESCALLTQPARAPLAVVHDRMPVVVAPELWERWLDPALTRVDALLREAMSGMPALAVHPVSTLVNDPGHDDARCFEPWEPPQGLLF